MRRLLALLLLAGLSLAWPAHAVTYYVDNTSGGSDSNTCLGQTAGTICLTIKHALTLVAPGDTICVNGSGTYTQASEGVSNGAAGVIHPTNSGTAGNYITLEACNGGAPIIDSSAAALTGSICCAIGLGNGGGPPANYWQIGPGLTLYGGADNVIKATCDVQVGAPNFGQPQQCSNSGVLAQGHHYIFTGLTVHDFGAGGITGSPTANNQIFDYLTITNNVIYNNANWAYAGASGISPYQLTNFDSAAGYHVVVKGNRIFNNQVKIFDECYSSPGCATNFIDGNGIIFDDGNHTQVNGGAPFTVPPYSGGVLVADNFVYFNGGNGVEAFQTVGVNMVGNTIFKNAQYSNADSGCAAPCSNSPADITFYLVTSGSCYGNIIYGKNGTDYYTIAAVAASGVACDYNDRFSGAGASLTGAHDITGDPVFVSVPTNSISANANIQTSSPAKNTFGGGVAISTISPDFLGSLRPQPATPNGSMGAAEFCTGACVMPSAPGLTGGRGGMFLRVAGTLPPPTYTGLGDLSTAVTWTGYWGLRSFSSASRGNPLINLCLPSDTACADIPSLSGSGFLSAAAVTALGCSNNCTIKTFYDGTGTGNNISQTTIASRATLTTSCTGMTGPFCFATTSATQYVVTLPTYASPFSKVAVVAGTGGAAFEGPMLATNTGGLFWQQGNSPQQFQAYTNAFTSHIETGTNATVNTWHSVQFSVGSGSSTGRISDNNTQVTASMTGGNMGPTFYIGNDGSGNILTANMTELAFGTGALTSGDDTAISANQRAAWGF